MRSAVLSLLALASIGAVAVSSLTPAAAVEYPWCIQGGGWGVPGDCSYRSYAECMTTASGRLVYCNINPRFAYRRQRQGRSY
jgi:Protein of unknown function (DUF3551)